MSFDVKAARTIADRMQSFNEDGTHVASDAEIKITADMIFMACDRIEELESMVSPLTHDAWQKEQGRIEALEAVVEAARRLPKECPYWGMGPCDPDCSTCAAIREARDSLAAYDAALERELGETP